MSVGVQAARDVARGEAVTAEEFVAANEFAANAWWWLGFLWFFVVVIPIAFITSRARSQPVILVVLPYACGSISIVALAQYPFLLYRSLRVRRASLVDDAATRTYRPRSWDFWVATAMGVVATVGLGAGLS